MNNHCHSPNPKLIFNNSKGPQFFNHCNEVQENVCLTNYGSPNSNMNLQTEQDKDNKSKITYQLSSKNISSPNRTLSQNQSMLFQNLSPPEITFSKNNNMISKSNSSNFSRKRKPYVNNNREVIKNNISKKNELLEKIRYISNRIDKTINLYKDRNNCINKAQQNMN